MKARLRGAGEFLWLLICLPVPFLKWLLVVGLVPVVALAFGWAFQWAGPLTPLIAVMGALYVCGTVGTLLYRR